MKWYRAKDGTEIGNGQGGARQIRKPPKPAGNGMVQEVRHVPPKVVRERLKAKKDQ